MKIPEGWPTREMIEAGNAVSPNRNVVAIFEEMLAAAPTPPAHGIRPCSAPYRSHECKDCGTVIEYDAPPAQEDEPVAQVLREALAWGMVYGPEIPGHQWDEMRESKVKEFSARLAAHPDSELRKR